jgi:hypothetical protein
MNVNGRGRKEKEMIMNIKEITKLGNERGNK